jgi:hypothetical protein
MQTFTKALQIVERLEAVKIEFQSVDNLQLMNFIINSTASFQPTAFQSYIQSLKLEPLKALPSIARCFNLLF